MAPKTRKKTDIPVPEPRHRVGPKGVSSGISFRELPPPSLGEIKKVCEHYQTKCAGTYNSLASRYVYQMATEIEDLVEALEGGYGSEGSLSSSGGCGAEPFAPFRDSMSQRSKKQRNSSAKNHRKRRMPNHISGGGTASKTSFDRPPTRHSRHSKVDERRKAKEIRFDFAHDDDSSDMPSYRGRQSYLDRQKYTTNTPAGYNSRLEQRNFEDQVQEVLGWLKDEMERSQSLVHRSTQIHDAELANAKREMDELKKTAKCIIKAVHKKGKDKTARSEAAADSERRRRVKSQKMMASMIKSHSAQMEHLKRGLHRNSSTKDSDSLAGLGLDLEEDSHTMRDENNPAELFSLAGDSDLTSILDGLAEEAYRQAYYH